MRRTLCLLALAAVAPLPAQAAFALRAEGVQIYICAAGSAGFAWKLQAPDATLRDRTGHRAGHHFAGPTWQATDGSEVTATPLVASPAPDPTAITWLVLRAATHTGNGTFATVAYITRTDTEGGKSPATGCDATHKGAETRTPYRATYNFFTGPP